jgi:hypothetical protein
LWVRAPRMLMYCMGLQVGFGDAERNP